MCKVIWEVTKVLISGSKFVFFALVFFSYRNLEDCCSVFFWFLHCCVFLFVLQMFLVGIFNCNKPHLEISVIFNIMVKIF